MALRAKRNRLFRSNNYLPITPQSTHTIMAQTKVVPSSSNTSTKSTKILANDAPVDEQHYCYSNPHLTLHQRYINNSNGSRKFRNDIATNSSEKDYLYRRPHRLAAESQHHEREKQTLSLKQGKQQPAGLKFYDTKEQLNVINLQLSDVLMRTNVDCLMLPQQHQNVVKSRTRATQTLFRESSAQTLPYLPGISNTATELENLEIFKLPTILPGDGPPGLYEVEVLERARKRWSFANALKENFRNHLQAARERVKLQEHEEIIEAFEWEHWIEREENIQECQMLRLELLIGMFNKRQREMHTASSCRIQKSFVAIETKRKAALKRNEIEHNRAIRRLEIKHAKQSRVWRKEHITHELGDPSSDFYAPKMRYGVNPNRQHYTASRSGFDMRMDDLEKKAIKMDPKSLKCPFAKLKKWSKPKEVFREIEQNFCSDSNLNSLYENLRILRETSGKQKNIPNCLKAKKPKEAAKEGKATKYIQEEKSDDITSKTPFVTANAEASTEPPKLSESVEELRQQKQAERLSIDLMQKERSSEELEALVCSSEGNTIGWLMRFLAEEMHRLKEQRRLQFLAMMAKRRRWHQEAAEAGLRQKENFIRESYEKLYEQFDQINSDIADTFLNSVLSADIKEYAQQTAEQDIVEAAKELDTEISEWLKSFEGVQHPLNYDTLRHALKDIFIPDVEKILNRHERDNCVAYIIDHVLLDKIYHELELYEVSSSEASDPVDHLLVDCLDCGCVIYCRCCRTQQIVEVLGGEIRQHSYPTAEKERIVMENIHALLEDVCNKVLPLNSRCDVEMFTPPYVTSQGAHADLVCIDNEIIITNHSQGPISVECDDEIKFKILNTGYKTAATDITKVLRNTEILLLADSDKLSSDDLLIKTNEYVVPEPKPVLSAVHSICSTHDFTTTSDFRFTPFYGQKSSDEYLKNFGMEETEATDQILSFDESCVEQLDSGSTEEEAEQQEQLENEEAVVEDFTEFVTLSQETTKNLAAEINREMEENEPTEDEDADDNDY